MVQRLAETRGAIRRRSARRSRGSLAGSVGAHDRRGREGRVRHRAERHQSVHRTSRFRSGSRTSCWWTTAQAPSWACRRTTSAISSSRASTASRSRVVVAPAADGAAGEPIPRHDGGRFERWRPRELRARSTACHPTRRVARSPMSARRRGIGDATDAVPPEGLGHLAPALLGHADSGRLLRHVRHGARAYDDLPVVLPKTAEFSGRGDSPLAHISPSS